jgi:hypothetical protein
MTTNDEPVAWRVVNHYKSIPPITFVTLHKSDMEQYQKRPFEYTIDALYLHPASCPNCAENLRYATQLATWLWKKRFEQDAPDWKPLDTLSGVLSQIDNMIAVLRFDCPHCAEKDARLRIAEDVITINKRESECVTVEDWKRKAEGYEYNWRCCSDGFNRVASKKDARIKELENNCAGKDAEIVENAELIEQLHKAIDQNWVQHQALVEKDARIKELEAESQKLREWIDEALSYVNSPAWSPSLHREGLRLANLEDEYEFHKPGGTLDKIMGDA